MLNRKLGHSKIKNAGILFELLTRQITVDLMESDKSKAVDILKKYFHNKTELGKEYQLYKVLVENKYSSESRAESLIDAVLESRKKLNNSTIKKEKYNAIKEIKECYDIGDFFNARIPNYKVLASIYNVFQTQDSVQPELYVKSKYTIVENLTINSKPAKKNKTFENEQKTLIKEYINNISNTNKLREYVNTEVDKVKKSLKKQVQTVDDKVTQIKLTEVVNQIDGLKKGKIVSDKQVVSMMRYYQLIEEIDHVANN